VAEPSPLATMGVAEPPHHGKKKKKKKKKGFGAWGGRTTLVAHVAARAKTHILFIYLFIFCHGVAEPPPMGWFGHPRSAEPPLWPNLWRIQVYVYSQTLQLIKSNIITRPHMHTCHYKPLGNTNMHALQIHDIS